MPTLSRERHNRSQEDWIPRLLLESSGKTGRTLFLWLLFWFGFCLTGENLELLTKFLSPRKKREVACEDMMLSGKAES